MKRCLPILVILAMVATANAAISVTFTPTNVTLADTTPLVKNVMTVDTDTEWTVAGLHLTLTAGTIYQDGFGNDFAPNPAFLGMFPDLALDSFITQPSGYPDMPSKAPGSSITTSEFIVEWFDDANAPFGAGTGQIIAQITLSPDAQGYISHSVMVGDPAVESVVSYVIDDDGQNKYNEGSEYWAVIDGEIVLVPEPVTMSLLAIGGIGVLLRKRR